MAAPNENPQDLKAGRERVAKVIARSGLCSRREAERLIADRRVSVNGAIIDSAALDITRSDTVLVDGRPLSLREPPRLWRYYKPKGRVTTHKDPEGRPTVFEALPEHLPRLMSIGRLDFNTEGLLLLTNDGDLARHLELPSTGWSRRYRVRAFGEVSDAQLKDLAGGITINKMSYGPIDASLEREQGDNVWISISIREGKNREVRRIMEHLGLTVNRLIRISFGPFILGDLEPGQIEEVKTAVLKDQLGPRLSRQLGVRREVPREERKLPPARGKPTYLLRKPAAEARPERVGHEMRPLKRRRIFQDDGSEAPKVEFVAERKPRHDRSQAAGDRNGRPELAKGGSGRAFEKKPPKGRDSRRGSFFETRNRNAEPGGFEERPFRTGRDERQDKPSGYPKRREVSRGPWRQRGEREQPDKDTKPAFRTGERTFAKAKGAAAGERGRPQQFGTDGEGQRPRRFENDRNRQGDAGPRSRKRSEQGSGERRPPQRFEATGAGAPGHGKTGGERGEGTRRTEARRKRDGEHKASAGHRTGEGGGPGGARKFHNKGPQGKTFGRSGKAAQGSRGGSPRNPRSGPRPGVEKETP
jgi:23S rRNA pseudouridine2605 synthase